MTTIDPGLVAALDIRRRRRDAFDRDPVAEHELWQTSSIDALLDGAYDGDLTLAELLAHGDLGIGTVQHLGHVIDATLRSGRLLVDGAHVLHLEIPAGVRVGDADTTAAKAAAIRAVEGGG